MLIYYYCDFIYLGIKTYLKSTQFSYAALAIDRVLVGITILCALLLQVTPKIAKGSTENIRNTNIVIPQNLLVTMSTCPPNVLLIIFRISS